MPRGFPRGEHWTPGVPNGSHCMDCGANTSYLCEYYMLKDDIWQSIVPTSAGMLCIGDAERRLGRELTPDDFDPYWTAKLTEEPHRVSIRLRSRMEVKPRFVPGLSQPTNRKVA